MSNRRVLLGVLVVLAVIALTVTATYAYFSGQDSTGNDVTVSLATIGVESTAGFPLEMTGLLPGQTSAGKIFTIKNTGTAPVDVYAWLVGTSNDPTSWGTEANFCHPDNVGVTAYMWNGASAGIFSGNVCSLFPKSGGHAVRLVSGLAPGASADFGIQITLPTTLGNEWQGAWNYSPVTFMATQVGVAPSVANYGQQLIYVDASGVEELGAIW